MHLTVHYKNIIDLTSSEETISKTSKKMGEFIKKIYSKNRKLLEDGFTPETNNVMGQLFSRIDNFID